MSELIGEYSLFDLGIKSNMFGSMEEMYSIDFEEFVYRTSIYIATN